MACDCDELANRLRNMDDRLRRLEGGRSGGVGGNNNQNNDDLLERVFRDKRWLAVCDCIKFIVKGKI
jgi:hypothetical protein